uniref:Uncharacterized protein n=1 Tax=Strongyloides papillosus TaxID=174720 RepID=A0A0N5C041_STREA
MVTLVKVFAKDSLTNVGREKIIAPIFLYDSLNDFFEIIFTLFILYNANVTHDLKEKSFQFIGDII